MVLGLVGVTLVEVCLHGVQKIPFTCSYLPGKSNVHITFWFCTMWLAQTVYQCCKWERDALEDPALYAAVVGGLAIAAVAARWWTQSDVKEDEAEVQFEDVGVPAVQILGLSGG